MCHTNITREDALTERLFQGTIHTLELFGVYLGKRLGLYRSLAERGAQTPLELAESAGIAVRYAREWLEQQAVADFLVVDTLVGDADARRYTLPEAHRGVLAEDGHAAHVAPFAEMLVGIAGALPRVVDAYRSGEGVDYTHYGSDFRVGQAGINRPAFSTDLAGPWLAALPDIEARLRTSTSARVADVGCGEGWSTIALARAYPDAEVIGYDLDTPSIEAARRNAAEAGVDVAFVCGDAAELTSDRPFDLILLLEALHDMSRPTEALRALRGVLASDGALLVADERVAKAFVAPGDEVERMMYGWSVSHCLPVAMADTPTAAIGTAIRPEIVERCARDAGFAGARVLPIDNDLFRFYRLDHAA